MTDGDVFYKFFRYIKELEGDALAPVYPHNPLVFDPEGTNYVMYYFTADMWQKLYACILHGADEIYPDETHEIQSAFLWPVEYPVSICDLVVQCLIDAIGEGNGISQVLIDLILNSPQFRDLLDGLTITGAAPDLNEPLFVGEGCDKDNLFGFVRQTVQLMNQLVIDAYERFETATNTLELLADAAEVVPPLSLALDYLLYLQNSVIENYNANYDVDYENDLICELFCFALLNDCTLTWANIRDVLFNRIGASLSWDTLADVLAFILEGTWQGDEFADLSLAVLAAVIALGGEWAFVTLHAILKIVSGFNNDPDSDWETYCTDCTDAWRATFDFSQGQEGWVIGVAGQFAGGLLVGTTHHDDPIWQKRCHALFDLNGETAYIDQAQVYVDSFILGGWDNTIYHWALSTNAVYVSDYLASYEQMGAVEEYPHAFLKAAPVTCPDHLTVDGRSSNNTSNSNLGAIAISKIVMWGHDTAPQTIIDNATEFVYL